MNFKAIHWLGLGIIINIFSGCAVVTTAVAVTATVVEGAIDVVDVVTPDIIDD